MKRIGYSTLGFSDRTVEAALEAIAAAGFSHAEILGQEPHVADPLKGQRLADFKRKIESLALQVNLHAPLKKNVLGAPDEEWRRNALKVLSNYLSFAGEIGAAEMIVHAVPNPIFVPETGDSPFASCMLDSARRSMDDLVPIAQGAKVRVLLENLPYLCDYPLQTMKELRQFIQSYPSDSVGLVLDTGHAKVRQDDPAEEILIAGDRLFGTHLHDTDETGTDDYHWLPGQGALDWNAIMRALAKVNYVGVMTFEIGHGRFGEKPEELARACCKLGEKWRRLSKDKLRDKAKMT